MLADLVLLYFSSPVGLALLFLHPFFYTLTCLYRTLVGSLPWFFTVRVLVSSRHPSRSSLLASSASPGSQRRLFIAFSRPLCLAGSAEAGLCSARRGSELLAIGECQLVDFWDWVFGFRCINKCYFSPAVGFRSRSWQCAGQGVLQDRFGKHWSRGKWETRHQKNADWSYGVF